MLGCYTVLHARARGTLVPMPSLALLHGLSCLLAATTVGPGRATPKSSCMGGRRQGLKSETIILAGLISWVILPGLMSWWLSKKCLCLFQLQTAWCVPPVGQEVSSFLRGQSLQLHKEKLALKIPLLKYNQRINSCSQHRWICFSSVPAYSLVYFLPEL